jgi:hypothetical protein
LTARSIKLVASGEQITIAQAIIRLLNSLDRLIELEITVKFGSPDVNRLAVYIFGLTPQALEVISISG